MHGVTNIGPSHNFMAINAAITTRVKSPPLDSLAECYLQCGRTEKVLIAPRVLPPPTHSFLQPSRHYKPAPSLLASRQGDERSKALQIARCGADLDLVFTTLAPIHMMQASFQPSAWLDFISLGQEGLAFWQRNHLLKHFQVLQIQCGF